MTLHPRHQEWLKERGLDPELCEKLGLDTVDLHGAKWIAVPYVENERTVNHKYRKSSVKTFQMDPGAPLTLWNHDILLDRTVTEQKKPVVITEGEWDALAVIQSGYRWTVSIPNGGTPPAKDAERLKLTYLERCQAVIDKVDSFIIATDADRVGLSIREELARNLGPWRCSFVEYPFPCKDMNEVLLEYGPIRVAQIIQDAKPYPIQGLCDFEDIPEPPPVDAIHLRIPLLKDHLFVVPGTLGVFTGLAGAGKTSLSLAIIADLIEQGVGVAIASFETMPKPILQTKLRAALAKCSDWDAKNRDMTEVDERIRKHFSLIYQQTSIDRMFTIEDILELGAVAVRRKGIRLLWIDPWNEIEHKRGDRESETDYTGRVLQTCKTFARNMGVAVWITAHPSKPAMQDFKTAPTLYSISGSAHFANKADYGWSLTRPGGDRNIVDIFVTKVRMGLPGKTGKVSLQYDFRTSEYLEIGCSPEEMEARPPKEKTPRRKAVEQAAKTFDFLKEGEGDDDF